MIDAAYTRSGFTPPQIEHHYGPGIHLIDDPLAWSLLARACTAKTQQLELNQLVRMLYDGLARVVIAAELPRKRVVVPTRMATAHQEAVYQGLAIDPDCYVVSVDIARAGTVPSQVVFELLNQVINPANVRQDHLFMSRQLNEQGQVTGAEWHDAKIGREIEGRLVLFPDPMGATGSSMISAINHYQQSLDGAPAKCVAMHLMVTPEYLRNLRQAHPDAVVYAIRLDRGLSSENALAAQPGAHWDEERGLSDTDYIVPGAGGVGELLNNAWV